MIMSPNQITRIIIKLLSGIPHVTTSIQDPPFFLWSTWPNARDRLGQAILTSTPTYWFPTLSQPINCNISFIHKPHEEIIILRCFHAQIPHQHFYISCKNSMVPHKILCLTHGCVLHIQSLIEERVIIVPNITPVQEKPATTSASWKWTAHLDQILAPCKAEITVCLREIFHALTKRINCGITCPIHHCCISLWQLDG